MARHDVRRENGRQRNARAQVVARAHDVTEMIFGGFLYQAGAKIPANESTKIE